MNLDDAGALKVLRRRETLRGQLAPEKLQRPNSRSRHANRERKSSIRARAAQVGKGRGAGARWGFGRDRAAGKRSGRGAPARPTRGCAPATWGRHASPAPHPLHYLPWDVAGVAGVVAGVAGVSKHGGKRQVKAAVKFRELFFEPAALSASRQDQTLSPSLPGAPVRSAPATRPASALLREPGWAARRRRRLNWRSRRCGR